MIKELTAMDISNASLLDEATSAAEAMGMSYSIHGEKRKKYFVSKHIFPQTIDVIKTRAYGFGIELVIDDPVNFDFSKAEEYCGVIFQNPDNLGNFKDLTSTIEQLHKNKVIVTVIADVLSLSIFKTPGEMNADIAVGSV
jgi:glycine dehydrogenase